MGPGDAHRLKIFELIKISRSSCWSFSTSRIMSWIILSRNIIPKYHPKISSRGRWKRLLLTWLKVFLPSRAKIPVKNPPTWKKQVVVTEGVSTVLNVLAYPMKCRALKWLWQIPLGNPVVPDDQKMIQVSFFGFWISTGSGAILSEHTSSIVKMFSTPSTSPKLYSNTFFLKSNS